MGHEDFGCRPDFPCPIWGRCLRQQAEGVGLRLISEWSSTIMPARRTTSKGYDTARKLRKELTPAEAKLWAYLRNNQLGVSFRRQHAIGNYVPDFVCIKKKLIIELDGSQHLEQEEYDSERTKYLESQGYKVIRFWNNEAMNNMNSVIQAIQSALEGQVRV